MGSIAALSVILTWKIMAFLLLVFSALVIADLFRRHLLSNGAVYTITMLIAPIAALVAIGTPIFPLLEAGVNDGKGLFKALVILAGSVLLFLLAAVIYVRGHIAPIDKTLDIYGDQQKLFAMKRLIKVGYTGTAVYGLMMIAFAVENIMIFYGILKVTNEIHPVTEAKDLVVILLFLAALLVVPCFNIIGFIIVFIVGTEFAALFVSSFMAFLLNMLVANGCIRYILTTDKTKGQKAIFIFLSFMPAFNIVYGFMCLKKISQELKTVY
ncbi:MAG: hypothetical protein J1E40_07645 [Oscillospiraceae bacterium]|nr:hypothetical protein [Oscillospiraceae bacterium]